MESNAICQSLETSSNRVNAGLSVLGRNEGKFMKTYFSSFSSHVFELGKLQRKCKKAWNHAKWNDEKFWWNFCTLKSASYHTHEVVVEYEYYLHFVSLHHFCCLHLTTLFTSLLRNSRAWRLLGIMVRFLRESHTKTLPEGEIKHHFINIRARTQRLLCKTIWQKLASSRDFELKAQLQLHFHPYRPPYFPLPKSKSWGKGQVSEQGLMQTMLQF